MKKIKNLTKPFRIIHNYFFCKKYPFYALRDIDGKIFTYDSTYYDYISKGWRKAFGKKLSRNLKNAIKSDGCKDSFRILDIKEKYGSLRIDISGFGDFTDNVIQYYENLSECYCILCGKPARYCTHGWITYLCEECFDKIENTNNPNYESYKLSCRLTKKNIPRIIRYDSEGNPTEVKYKIDYEKLWGLKDGKK